ncbi:NAD(+)/NADH kinase [Mesosutterella sp. OilRF-GAM-744-9]|uniref:NAD kinase n=1 Tax=Mesosutterella porci TaxID=2915351 RepID=A0ABS9MTT0_9BURK|nr:NAD(+)/NADH kinase [Mesosutterella sp. oilRF-744-WT-GAM-9]MCG5031650.1 NAD(+)/NADH kinase [Mesosutterella sp. oilRF-744-WT-GAM-9]
MPVFKKAAIFVKQSGLPRSLLARLLDVVCRSGVEPLLDEAAFKTMGEGNRWKPHSPQELGEKADVAIVLGGDGTTLGVGRLLAPYGRPIIGINAGRLGFITDIVLEEVEQIIPQMMEGRFVRDDRPVIEGSVLHKGKKVYESNAINDAGITHGRIGGMVEFTIYVDGQRMSTQRADGIIYATTTGSTAYALAAGGPILHPSLLGAELVPVAPHTLTNRPIVLPLSSVVDIELTEVKDGQAYFDMQEFWPMDEGDVLHIHVGKNHFSLLHPAGYNHFDLLRRKLKWNLMPTNPGFSQQETSGE